MVYRRRTKRTYRRKTYRRRNFKAKYRRGYKRSGSNKVYYFTRYMQLDQQPVIPVSSVTPYLNSYTFSLSQVAGYTDFTNLYDMYKINAVKVSMYPQQTMSNSLSTVNNADASVRFYSVIDRNDNGGVASIDELREYKTCKFTPILRPHKRYIMKPKILDRGATYTPGNPWINCDTPGQLYYGLKIGVEPMFSSIDLQMTFTMEVKFYLAFKNVK